MIVRTALSTVWKIVLFFLVPIALWLAWNAAWSVAPGGYRALTSNLTMVVAAGLTAVLFKIRPAVWSPLAWSVAAAACSSWMAVAGVLTSISAAAPIVLGRPSPRSSSIFERLLDAPVPAWLTLASAAAAPIGALVIATWALGWLKHGQLRLGAIRFGAQRQPILQRAQSDTHGSARLAIDRELDPLRAPSSGLILAQDKAGNLLRWAGEGHVLVVAKTGGGKGVAFINPSLLLAPDGNGPGWTGSAVIVDPKGESAAICVPAREAAGHRCLVIDPFRIEKLRSCAFPETRFNPLDLVRPATSPDFARDVRMISGALVERSKNEKAHFTETARTIINGCLAFVCLDTIELPSALRDHGFARSLGGVSDLYWRLRGSEDFRTAFLAELVQHPRLGGGLPGMMASALVSTTGDELSGLWSTVGRQVEWLSDARMRGSTDASDFTISDILLGKLSVFVCAPDDVLADVNRWVRLLITTAVEAVKRAPRKPEAGVLVLVDEMASVGCIVSILDPTTNGGALTIGRGAGLRIVGVGQSFAQIKALYGEDGLKTWMDNADVTLCLGLAPAAHDSAETLSKTIGDGTFLSRGESSGSGGSTKDFCLSGSSSSNRGESTSEVKRRILLADEILNLSPDECLVLTSRTRPFRAKKARYFQHPQLALLASPNPYRD